MLIGRRLGGRYKILNPIGGGGMANVYLARDVILERDVAIKVLRFDYANDESFIKRFHREAQSAASIDHPNIVSIYDVDEEDEIYYIVMEYVPGQTLKEYIGEHSPLHIEKALDIMKQITSAIAHAHEFGIIHRDLKPQNILIDHDDRVKVTDFGIALALSSSTTITQTNSVLGTVHYLSPEQARGGLATKKSDIYSLGILLFELLTGRVPFSGESAVSVALKHLQTNTPSPKRWNPYIPQSVENIVLKATAKDPFYRYDSVEEMEYALSVALNPDKLNEEKFQVPDDEEVTKAIPIVKEDDIEEDEHTLVHHKESTQAPTENVPQDKKKPKKRKGKIFLITFLTLLFLAGAGIAAITLVPSFFAPKDVKIPEVAGKEYEEALKLLISKGFDVSSPIAQSSETIEEGKIIRTDPKEGTTVKEGDQITLYQSSGKKKTVFDDYTGRNIDEVKKLLEQRGFKNINVEEEESEEPKGTVIEHDPDENDEVIAEDTEVNLKVSSGPPAIVLQNYEGWQEKSVRDFATSNGLKVSTKEEYSDETAKGLVVSQTPTPGTQVEQGTTINIVVSKGEEPKPPKEHTVEVTIPYEPSEPEPENEVNPNLQQLPQKVDVYIDDANHDSNVPFESFTITEDTVKTYTLTVKQGETASYKIVRDDKVLQEETVPYEDDE
jgi:eukaryotic-like serine/threonine-protein kinase